MPVTTEDQIVYSGHNLAWQQWTMAVNWEQLSYSGVFTEDKQYNNS